MPLTWVSSLSFIPMILRFGIFMVSQIFCMFWSRSFLGLEFSLTSVSILLSCLQCLRFSLPSLIFYRWGLSPRFLFEFLNFSFPDSTTWTVLFISSSCLIFFKDFFNGFVHFLYQDLYRIYKGYFKVLQLCVSHVAVLRVCHGRVVGLYQRCAVLAVIAHNFMVAFRHLGLGRLKS